MTKRKHILSLKQVIGSIILLFLVGGVEVFLHFVPQRVISIPMVDSSIIAQADTLHRKRYRYTYDTIRIHLQPFDPNTADSITLLQLGLKRWQVRNLLRYRAAGGCYRRAEDMRKLYGMTDSAYRVLAPYIQIDSSRFIRRDRIQRDSVHLPKYVSIKRDTVIELNSCDTATLQHIRGIGPYIAKQIISYREQLGGYYSPDQIRDISLLQIYDKDSLMSFAFDSILPYLMACADSIRAIPVNHSSVQRLQRHPYLRYEQAKAIYTLRRNHFRLEDIEQLYEIPELDSITIERLRPYLSFE